MESSTKYWEDEENEDIWEKVEETEVGKPTEEDNGAQICWGMKRVQ
jgi:hypothetical protein